MSYYPFNRVSFLQDLNSTSFQRAPYNYLPMEMQIGILSSELALFNVI